MKNKTDITVILDRSGSMNRVKADTIGGFNNFVETQRKVKGQASLSLIQFDDQYEVLYINKDIALADKLTDETFLPRGMTALLDAVGITINSAGQRFAALPTEERPDKVLFVILTDGFENASKEYKSSKINEMITHQRGKYKWEFMFIGANQDAVLSAQEIGIPASAALTYAGNAKGTEILYSRVASKIASYRQSENAAALQFTDEDRKEQKEAGDIKI